MGAEEPLASSVKSTSLRPTRGRSPTLHLTTKRLPIFDVPAEAPVPGKR